MKRNYAVEAWFWAAALGTGLLIVLHYAA